MVKSMLVLGYVHVILPRTVRSHLAKDELLHATKVKGNNCAFSILERNHIPIHPKVSIIEGTYIKFNFQLMSTEGE
jgi:hypothetical protein